MDSYFPFYLYSCVSFLCNSISCVGLCLHHSPGAEWLCHKGPSCYPFPVISYPGHHSSALHSHIFVTSRTLRRWNGTSCNLWGLPSYTQRHSQRSTPSVCVSTVCSQLRPAEWVWTDHGCTCQKMSASLPVWGYHK